MSRNYVLTYCAYDGTAPQTVNPGSNNPDAWLAGTVDGIRVGWNRTTWAAIQQPYQSGGIAALEQYLAAILFNLFQWTANYPPHIEDMMAVPVFSAPIRNPPPSSASNGFQNFSFLILPLSWSA
jgi:hypothetical protein